MNFFPYMKYERKTMITKSACTNESAFWKPDKAKKTKSIYDVKNKKSLKIIITRNCTVKSWYKVIVRAQIEITLHGKLRYMDYSSSKTPSFDSSS